MSSFSIEQKGEKQEVTLKRSGNGFHTFIVKDFRAFGDLIDKSFRENTDFVWRGSRNPDWHLISTLTRKLRTRELPDWQRDTSRITTNHLRRFLMQLRGVYEFRTEHMKFLASLHALLAGPTQTFSSVLAKLEPEQQQLVFEMFALGQHHLLDTPLLDWSRSPYVALYFAFEGADEREDGIGYRAIYALNQRWVEYTSPVWEPISDNSIRFIESMAFQNPRILGQSGLFTFSPTHLSIEDWVTKNFEKENDKPVLLRFLIENKMRRECISWLDQMNINPRSLFPDLQGVCREANYQLESKV